ncbi:MAG TPA: hypothetical protein VMS17_06970 [Gemmataceae bacterium]|nr:hypothetical protein [Gemmataceae bacterium]
MHRLWRGALPLVAAALGFARPASAQSLPASDPAPTAFAEADDAVLVPPHRRVVLEPMKEPPNVQPTNLQPTTDLIVPASAATTRPAVDLIAPGPVPPGWWSKATPLRAPAVPSGQPGAAPAAMPAAHVWPAAFLVEKKESDADPIKRAVHVEPAAEAPAPAEKPTVADGKRRVDVMVGAKADEVFVETGPSGDVLIHVHVHAADADQQKAKILEWTKVVRPGVRVLLDVAP